MSLSGELLAATSNPPLYGKPARLTLKGETPGAATALALEATLDQTRTPTWGEASLRWAGIPLSGTVLGDDELGALVKAGTARLNGTLRVKGDEWKGQILLQAEGVTLEPRVGLAGPAGKYAALALAGVRRFTMTIGIEGKDSALKFRLDSDLGAALADGLRRAFSDQLAAQRKVLEERVNALYAERAKALSAQTQGLESSLLVNLVREFVGISTPFDKLTELRAHFQIKHAAVGFPFFEHLRQKGGLCALAAPGAPDEHESLREHYP